MTDPHHTRSKDDLIQMLRDQTTMLTELGGKFDEGPEMWAMPLAAIVRTLVSDTSAKSKSLLAQLKVKDRLRLFDMSIRINPANLATTPGLFGWQEKTGAEGGIRAVPNCSMPPGLPIMKDSWTPFKEWWTRPVTKDSRGSLFSRKEYIEHVANKDGGTHVQGKLPARYAAISRENSMGWVFEASDGRVAMPVNPMLAGVRQIAYEVETTLRKQFLHWVGPRTNV